jgi:phytol kinase
MWLDSYFSDKLAQDIVATIITLAAALAWLRLVDTLAHRGLIEQRLSRKIIHIGTGPLFVLCWNFFSAAEHARYLAALVPLAITAQFVLVGLGLVQDPAAVQAMTRHGDRREILRGPVYYGLVFIVCTLAFWRTNPAGILALMLMCGGDGLADIAGRRLGRARLPINPNKTWAGSAAMFVGGLAFGLAFLLLFNAWGYFEPALASGRTAAGVALIALAAAVVEAMPVADIDNITITLTAIVLAPWLL